MQHTLLSTKTIFSRLKWVVGVKNAILFKKILFNMFVNSLKGKFSMCPTELIHPKRASLKDNILPVSYDDKNLIFIPFADSFWTENSING